MVQSQGDKLILYSFRRCPFAIRVRMVLEEKNLPYHVHEENLKNLSQELLSLHPQGKVPLLVHQLGSEQYVIYQSTVITEYLDDRYKQTPLMPQNPIERMQVRLWTYWCDHIFKPDLDLFKYKRSVLSEAETLALVSRLHGHFLKWNSALEEREFLVTDGLTLADIHLFPFARQFLAIQDSLSGLERYANVHRWLKSISSRPAFVRAMQESIKDQDTEGHQKSGKN